jgi:hypothetical protein
MSLRGAAPGVGCVLLALPALVPSTARAAESGDPVAAGSQDVARAPQARVRTPGLIERLTGCAAGVVTVPPATPRAVESTGLTCGFDFQVDRDGAVRMQDRAIRFQLFPGGRPPSPVEPPRLGTVASARPLEERLDGGFGFTFDLTDLLMRAVGQDPYIYEKRKLFAATFEWRAERAAQVRREEMRAALSALPSRLRELWADAAIASKKKALLLREIWDEVDATSADGQRARRIIENFARTRGVPLRLEALAGSRSPALRRR